MTTISKQLPAKENALFRSVVKCYEMKLYKKGLKAAEQILKKYPEHGETLAMKGLTLRCLNKKEEAYEYVRLGLRYDLHSHVCWHVYGLLYRMDLNYPEAIKCYRNALRLDSDNLQILRDLYLLQIQKRDLKGFAETRRTLLTLKPNNRNNWIGFAIAHHLLGNYQMAMDIVEKYLNSIENNSIKTEYEDSELYFYYNQLMEEAGEYEKALTHLETYKTQMRDTLMWRQKKAELLLYLKQYQSAIELYEELLEINEDQYEYHHGIQCALVQREDWLKLKELPSKMINWSNELKGKEMKEILIEYYKQRQLKADSKSITALRIPLDFTTGTVFEAFMDQLLRQQLSKGVPSLGSSIKSIYSIPENVQLIEKLILGYIKELNQGHALLPNPSSCSSPNASLKAWTLYLLAQHYDRVGNYLQAIESIDQCIQLIPSEIDFIQRKARIFKHMGKIQEAATIMNQARELDLSDRYINNKTTEYLLHADRIQEADATIALFTRHEGDPQQNLYEMQCIWYAIENGFSQLRQQAYGCALKRFFAVEKHFNDFIEDQFDFHTYCIRKMTLRSYIDMLRLCDGIFNHKFFFRAAQGAITTYLALDNEKNQQEMDENEDEKGKSAAEKKRLKREKAKARKAEFRKREEEELKAKIAKEIEEKENEALKKKNHTMGQSKKIDEDPLGKELLKKPALEEAWRWVSILKQYASERIETHLMAYEIAKRKQKILLCLQALIHGHQCLKTASSKQKEEWNHQRIQFEKEIIHVENSIIRKVIEELNKEWQG